MRLLDGAVRASDFVVELDLAGQVWAHQYVADEAARRQVGDVSMGLPNRPAAELYIKTSRMELETAPMRAPGISRLRKANAAMLTAKASAVTTKAAAVPGGNYECKHKYQTSNKKKSKASAGNMSNDNSETNSSKSTNGSSEGRGQRPSGAPKPAATSAADKSRRADPAGRQ